MQRFAQPVLFGFVILVISSYVSPAFAQNTPREQERLTVAITERPPFVIKNADGTWSGFSTDLWRSIAEKLELKYEFLELDRNAMLEALAQQDVDIGVAALTPTSEQEDVFDFTHDYFHSGLGIAVVSEAVPSSWMRVFRVLLSRDFLKIVGGLIVILLVLGALVWMFERRKNPEQFGGKALHGICDGFWWSAVTMTTVGYGDKSPQTAGGRIVALFCMFTSLIVLAFFTASITSMLTVAELGPSIRGPEDLPGKRVGSIGDSNGDAYLRDRRISRRTFNNPTDMLRALQNGEVDAVIGLAPILRYISSTQFDGAITMLPRRLQKESYALALPQGSVLREQINRQLLREINSPEWRDILSHYMSE